jgi:hypothetical protein
MKTSFLVHDNNKIYKISLRDCYQSKITNEAKFREVVEKEIKRLYGEKAFDLNKKSIWYYSGTVLGIVGKKEEVKKNLKTGKWEIVK